MPKTTRKQKLELARRLRAAALSMNLESGLVRPGRRAEDRRSGTAARAFAAAYPLAEVSDGTWWAWIAELAQELELQERELHSKKVA